MSSKVLTDEVARANIGKYVDSFRRNGIYPMKIVEMLDGTIALMTISGCCIIQDFNIRGGSENYDYIFTMSEEDDAEFMRVAEMNSI